MGLPVGIATQTVTFLRPQRRLDHGALVADWTKPGIPIVVSGCSIQPAKGAEDELHRTGDRADLTVWAPISADVAADYHADIDGYARPFRVIGEPERWQVGFLDHIVVRLQVWEG